MAIGFYLGVVRGAQSQTDAVEQERERTLKVLSGLVTATEQLTSDVNVRNTEIRDIGQNIGELDLDGELHEIQHALMTQVTSVLESNLKLEDDLTYTQCQVEEQAQEIDRTRREARTDALSGLGNRKAMDEKIKMMLANYRREEIPFVLMLCDVDKFKWINDTHGHQAGDNVVESVGAFLLSCIRDADFVARYGGDEFAMLLHDIDIETAAMVSERLRKRVSQRSFDLGSAEQTASVTFSIGVTSVAPGITADDLIERADKALYESKEQGRNKSYCFVDEELVPAPRLMRAADGERREQDEEEATDHTAEDCPPEGSTTTSDESTAVTAE